LATAVLVLALPIFDAVWAAVRRIAKGNSPFKADRQHIHHLLLDAGLSQREAVLVLYTVALASGMVALFVGSFGKMVAIITSALFVTILVSILLLLSWIKVNRRGTNK